MRFLSKGWRVRCLLDEGVSPALVPILTALGHPTQHASDEGLDERPDEELLEAAKGFDLFITLDLHRQLSEWQASRRSMLDAVRVLRIRFRSSQRDDGLEQARALLWRWREIQANLNENPEIRLTTLSGQTYGVRFSTAEDLRAMPGPRTPS